MAEKKVRKPLPLWSRLLIILVTMMFFGSVYGVISGVGSFKRAFEHAEEPAYIKKVANRIARFPDPLPDGFKYIFGFEMGLPFLVSSSESMSLKIVVMDYRNGKQQLSLISFNQKRDAKELLDQAYKIGLNTYSVSGHFTKVVSQGGWTVHGTTIPYVVGNLTTVDGEEYLGLVSAMSIPNKEKSLLIYAVEPHKTKKFDLNVCMQLLKELSNF